MRKSLALALAAAALALSLAGAATAGNPPRFTGRAAVVANGATGEILYAHKADRRVAIASITKIMTALVALEHARPGKIVTVRPTAASVGESTIHLRPGERLPVRDLLAAALVQSANDAAWALAAHVGEGDVARFVRMMNAKARALGLRRTRFVRPDGLDVRGHHSTARDVLALARAAMRKPAFRRLVRLRRATIAGGRRLETWNDLLGSFPGLVGVKTGHTAAARWSEVAAARRGGVTIYAVLLGSPTRGQRNRDLAELLEWGLDQYRRVTLIDPDRVYARSAVPFSDEALPLVPRHAAHEVVRLGRPLVEKVVAPATVSLPVDRRERIGEVRVYAGKRLVARRPLVAARRLSSASVGDRLGWYAGRALAHAGHMLESVLGVA